MSDTIKKYGDVKRIHHKITYENGKPIHTKEEIVLKDCYILIKENGDSFVGTSAEFKRLGLEIPADITTKIQKQEEKNVTK